jgi:FMN phosphatase YigB (HAD superfamily)
MYREKVYHIPRTEAVEKFIENSKYYGDRYLSRKEEESFYLDIMELASDWELWHLEDYSDAIDTLKFLKKRGYKVKVINKGNQVLIFNKRR